MFLFCFRVFCFSVFIVEQRCRIVGLEESEGAGFSMLTTEGGTWIAH